MPFDTRQVKEFFNREIAFQEVENLGFDLGFLSFARNFLFPELHCFKDHFTIANQIVHRDAERVGKRNQNAELGMDSLRSYLPIAWAVTRFPISPLMPGRQAAAERASLSLCPGIFLSSLLRVYKSIS